MPVTGSFTLGRVLATLIVLTAIATSCADDDPATGSSVSPTRATSVIPSSVSTSTDTATVPASSDATPDVMPPLQVVASLGYPRDLLDRGRVNLKISRGDDGPLVILDKQLVADHFVPAPPEARRSVLPPNGRVVALQTLFGQVDDCDDPAPVTAVLRLTYATSDEGTTRTGEVPVTDATTLDRIRLRTCTGRQVLATTVIQLRRIVLDDETASADLVITRTDGDARLAFDAIKGTVLFGAATEAPAGSPGRVLEPGQASLTIRLLFDVNRCDPHAVAETTRKYGLDLYVAVDGAEAIPIDVPIDAVRPDLEAMLDRCKARTE